jgi:lysozyme
MSPAAEPIEKPTAKKRKDGRTTRNRRVSSRGAKFVGNFEGFESHPYQDTGGVWTIGFGHTHGVNSRTQPITREQGIELLREDLSWAAAAVNKQVLVALNQPEFDAAVSLTFNIGAGALAESTFLRELNKGHRRRAADAMNLWVRDAYGGVQPGLVRRRAAERRVFLRGYKPRVD